MLDPAMASEAKRNKPLLHPMQPRTSEPTFKIQFKGFAWDIQSRRGARKNQVLE